MADEDSETQVKSVNSQSDDVFINGESESGANNLLTPDTCMSRPVLPRRSSLVKDHSRRAKDRKKTVSFSSMPNEKPVVNGIIILIVYIIRLPVACPNTLLTYLIMPTLN